MDHWRLDTTPQLPLAASDSVRESLMKVGAALDVARAYGGKIDEERSSSP
jgi:hypothetical protein